jgi:hypothetical protein
MKTYEKLDVEFHAFSSLIVGLNTGILLSGKVPHLPTVQEDRWALKLVWLLWRKKKYLASNEN